jgi:hypothetical protein
MERKRVSWNVRQSERKLNSQRAGFQTRLPASSSESFAPQRFRVRSSLRLARQGGTPRAAAMGVVESACGAGHVRSQVRHSKATPVVPPGCAARQALCKLQLFSIPCVKDRAPQVCPSTRANCRQVQSGVQDPRHETDCPSGCRMNSPLIRGVRERTLSLAPHDHPP